MAKTEKTVATATFEEHPRDLVAAEVVFPRGIRENGRVYKCGEVIAIDRGHAMAQNKPDKKVFKILRTVRYKNDPNPDANYEEQPEDGPIDVTLTQG